MVKKRIAEKIVTMIVCWRRSRGHRAMPWRWVRRGRLIRRATGTSSVPAVDLESVTRGAVPREQRGTSLRTGAQARLERGVVEIAHQRITERLRPLRRDEQAGVADDLLDRTGPQADDRRARGERLERGEPEPFEQRGMQQALGAGVKRRELRVGHVPREDDAFARRFAALERRVEERGELAQVARDDEAQIAVPLRRARERRHQAVHVLAWI